MKILDLVPTHNQLRSRESVDYFKKVIHKAGYDIPHLRLDNAIAEALAPINLTRLKDNGKLYIWNGHHRLAAAHQLGMSELSDEAFVITDMTIAQICSINLEVGYVTPFHPVYECRTADFGFYKKSILSTYKKAPHRYADLLLLMLASNWLYREQRIAENIGDLKYASIS